MIPIAFAVRVGRIVHRAAASNVLSFELETGCCVCQVINLIKPFYFGVRFDEPGSAR